MAEVALRGDELLADVDAADPPAGGGCFWWLGQHSFLLKLAGRVVYVDPYLSPSPARRTPPLFAPEQARNADLVLCTHDHGDHIDPFALAGIAAASPRALFAAPRPHRERMLEIGIPPARLRPLRDGETLREGGLAVTAVKARHEFFDEGPEGFPHLGYVIEGGGACCYHAGDTLVYEGLLTTLRRWKLDAAFLPINGRDAARYRRGILGNMSYQEAAELAGDLGVGLAVPAHWDMFAQNSADPALFVEFLGVKYPGVPAWTGPAGERAAFGARA